MEWDDKATEFVVFCIENTATRLGISGDELYKEMKRLGAIERFLYPSYAALHTQSKEYIVDETLEYLRQIAPDFVNSKIQNKV
ncbi:MAG: DUF3791 domain-containing protein [Prevotella sp.]|nr:DUF3791 domain-containing protein [Prevotella sp.]